MKSLKNVIKKVKIQIDLENNILYKLFYNSSNEEIKTEVYVENELQDASIVYYSDDNSKSIHMVYNEGNWILDKEKFYNEHGKCVTEYTQHFTTKEDITVSNPLIHEYEYNKNGNLISVSFDGNVEYYKYHPKYSNLVTVISNSVDDNEVMKYYDDKKRLIKEVDTDGAMVLYSYDCEIEEYLNNKNYSFLNKKYFDNEDECLGTENIVYDQFGNEIYYKSDTKEISTTNFYNGDTLLMSLNDNYKTLYNYM